MSDGLPANKRRRYEVAREGHSTAEESSDLQGLSSGGNSKLVGEALAVYRRLVRSSAAPDTVPTVHELNERYRRLVKIGEGSFGEVYIIFDTHAKTYLTMKRMFRFLHSPGGGMLGLHNTTCRELSLLTSLEHPNIVSVVDYHILLDGTLILLMPVIAFDFICVIRPEGRLRPVTLRVPLPTAKCYFRQLLSAVAYLHRRRVVHRDIKLSNLMVDADGTLKLIDYGWSCVLPQSAGARMTGPIGALTYRPPEVLVGGRYATHYDRSVDLWGCGCILFEMLTDGLKFVTAKTEAEAAAGIVDWLGSPAADSTVYTGKEVFRLREGCKSNFSARCHHNGIAPDEIRFLRKMLQLEPKQRASAAALLEDRWFTTEPLPCSPSELVLPEHNAYRWLESRRRSLGINL